MHFQGEMISFFLKNVAQRSESVKINILRSYVKFDKNYFLRQDDLFILPPESGQKQNKIIFCLKFTHNMVAYS